MIYCIFGITLLACALIVALAFFYGHELGMKHGQDMEDAKWIKHLNSKEQVINDLLKRIKELQKAKR